MKHESFELVIFPANKLWPIWPVKTLKLAIFHDHALTVEKYGYPLDHQSNAVMAASKIEKKEVTSLKSTARNLQSIVRKNLERN